MAARRAVRPLASIVLESSLGIAERGRDWLGRVMNFDLSSLPLERPCCGYLCGAIFPALDPRAKPHLTHSARQRHRVLSG